MAERTCSIPGCPNAHFARGWCKKHHHRWRRHGDPMIVKRFINDHEARFWSKVDQNGPIPGYRPELGACWLWTGAMRPSGHGTIQEAKRNGRTVGSHRFAYELLVGPIPPGLDLDHLCRVPACVRPDHLEPVTRGENILRGYGPSALEARQTHCKRGHEFTPENTAHRPRGNGRTSRRCRICEREAVRRQAERRRRRY